jgi:hypothetical protein
MGDRSGSPRENFVNAPGHPSILVSLLIAALIAWRFYYRVRRMVGRQRLSKVRPWVTVCVLPTLLLVFIGSSIARPMSLLAVLSGTVVGVALGIYGLRATRFEPTPDGLYYTPSAHLGIALSVLLLGRVGYRMAQVYIAPNPGVSPPPVALAGTPITLLIFGALAGYYVTYAIGLLRWRRSIPATPSPAPNADTGG